MDNDTKVALKIFGKLMEQPEFREEIERAQAWNEEYYRRKKTGTGQEILAFTIDCS